MQFIEKNKYYFMYLLYTELLFTSRFGKRFLADD